jgi:hypothetical protein
MANHGLQDFVYGALNGWGMNYDALETLDVIHLYLDNVGIKSIDDTKSSYMITIEFNDGTIFNGWNTNRWYAWLSQGVIDFSNGEQLVWYSKRPRYKVIYRLKTIVKNWEKEKKRNSPELDFTKYLPTGYTKRMERLKKLEELEKNNKKN